jgi:hypothetical protein
VAPLQHPFGQDWASHTHCPSVEHLCPPEHVAHAAPATPQLASLEVTHSPVVSQQPEAQRPAPQEQAPPTHACPAWHAAQRTPPIPHAVAVVAVTQWSSTSQQPSAQEVASQLVPAESPPEFSPPGPAPASRAPPVPPDAPPVPPASMPPVPPWVKVPLEPALAPVPGLPPTPGSRPADPACPAPPPAPRPLDPPLAPKAPVPPLSARPCDSLPTIWLQPPSTIVSAKKSTNERAIRSRSCRIVRTTKGLPPSRSPRSGSQTRSATNPYRVHARTEEIHRQVSPPIASGVKRSVYPSRSRAYNGPFTDRRRHPTETSLRALWVPATRVRSRGGFLCEAQTPPVRAGVCVPGATCANVAARVAPHLALVAPWRRARFAFDDLTNTANADSLNTGIVTLSHPRTRARWGYQPSGSWKRTA